MALLLSAAPSAMSAYAADGTVSVMFVGDIMLDGGPGHVVTNGGDPFVGVASVLGKADLTIGNLECAIVKKGHAADKSFTFRGPEQALPVLKKYFSAVSLANNHSGDWGKQGFVTELELLQEYKLPWFGGGVNAREAHRPLMLEAAGKRIAFLGYSGYPPRSFAAGPSTPGTAWLVQKEAVRDIKRARAEADVVLLFLHWGDDLEPAVAPEQRALAHALLDAGADAIIGSHSHVTQEVEWYNDKPILYGIGNFLFDYFPHDPPVWTGWIVRLTFGRSSRPTLELIEVQLDPAGLPHLTSH
jgi:poly-gamma-glutamate capsule biosynthesis protein CapA/YwtB (metallophosphatase superfamily)